MAHDFASSIAEHRRPVSDGYSGYRVVRLLELAQRSMSQNGRPVDIPADGVTATPEPVLVTHNGDGLLQQAVSV
jgi:hypothetical protein